MVDRHHPGQAPTALLATLSDGSCRTIVQLEADLDLNRRQVSDAASCLLRRDYLMRMALGCYQLTEAGLSAAENGEVITSGPRGARNAPLVVRNTLRERAWCSMRLRRCFTVPDLVSDAATEADGRPEDNIHRYLRGLRRAGFIKALPRRAAGTAMTSNGFKRWLLTRDTGPRAPIILSKVDAVHDPNTGEDVACDRP